MVMSWLQDAVPAHHGASVPQALKFPVFKARRGDPIRIRRLFCALSPAGKWNDID